MHIHCPSNGKEVAGIASFVVKYINKIEKNRSNEFISQACHKILPIQKMVAMFLDYLLTKIHQQREVKYP
jgi:hypothetical protein